MIEQSVDVLVAGGGPGGLSAAETIARAGCSVLVAEQNHEIGSPIRTSGGSFASELKALGIPESMYHVVNRCRFLAPHNEAQIDYRKPNLCVMDVRRVFQFLAERAVDAGARIRTATQVTDVIRSAEAITGGRLKCGTNESLVHSRVIVDATGYRASLLKKAGVHEGFERFGVGAEYDLYAPKYDESEAVLIVGGQVAPAGYAWFLPYGRHRVRAGVGIIHKDSASDPHEYLDLLVSKAASFRVDLMGAQPIESHYGLIPSDGVARTYTADGIVGVGDAAGQASCLVGEGIRWAIKAGRMAGEVVAGCIHAGDISHRALIAYEKRWSTAFGRNLRIAHAINKRIARWTDEAWDRRTDLIKSLTDDQFDQALQSNFFAPWVARLLLRHPEFVSQGVRGVVKRAGLVS